MTLPSYLTEDRGDLRDLIAFVQDGVGWKGFDKRREKFRREFTKRALRVLGTYPPRRQSLKPFRWSKNKQANDRARRWFFANYPEGYERTGALGKAWDVRMSITRAGLDLLVGNTADVAGRVYGSSEGGQIPGHSDTGWFDADAEVTELADEAALLLGAELDAMARELR